ncbi:uncharacterized protein LOC107792513 isoform X2 [Nicotiana tabacum]|uniref:Uncharacterized protein LOC107792513 isoform X2 n=1 Tax=Nicotiana tabacum TaxID=4097 RepID=A0AC58RSL1_TOBAC
MDGQNHSQTQSHDNQSTELYSSSSTEVQENKESGNSKARKVRGPTLLKDIWKLPPGKKIVVQFNTHNQAIGKEGLKLASFLGIIERTPDLTPLHIDDWQNFDKEEKKKLLEFVRRRTQANKNNRAKQNVPHIGGSKSIATLMDEQAKNGIEPTRAEIFILTYKKRKNGRLLDEESAKAVVVDTNHDHERIPESPNMHNVAGNTPSSCG